MYEENEILMLLLGIGVVIFALVNRRTLRGLPAHKFFFSGFYVLFVGWILTVLEGFVWKEFLNYLEHLCYAGSSLLVATWFWKVFRGKKEDE